MKVAAATPEARVWGDMEVDLSNNSRRIFKVEVRRRFRHSATLGFGALAGSLVGSREGIARSSLPWP